MKEDEGVPVSEEVQKVLEQEQVQAGRYSLADFFTQGMLLRVNRILISYGNDGWHCSCQIFHEHQTCRHLMALKLLIPSFPSFDLGNLAEGFKKE